MCCYECVCLRGIVIFVVATVQEIEYPIQLFEFKTKHHLRRREFRTVEAGTHFTDRMGATSGPDGLHTASFKLRRWSCVRSLNSTMAGTVCP